MKLSDYVVTEGGFGADLGAEKFFDIKCRKTGLKPSCAVVVATCRALKLHGGADEKTLSSTENVEAVKKGMCNLERHIQNVQKFGVPVMVAINVFPTDTDAEIQATQEACNALGVRCVRSDHHNDGGDGALDFAQEVVNLIDENPNGKRIKLVSFVSVLPILTSLFLFLSPPFSCYQVKIIFDFCTQMICHWKIKFVQ